MVEYKCKTCEKKFSQKGHYDYHVNHKVCQGKEYKCPHCIKRYSNNTNMYRHIRQCHKKPKCEKYSDTESDCSSDSEDKSDDMTQKNMMSNETYVKIESYEYRISNLEKNQIEINKKLDDLTNLLKNLGTKKPKVPKMVKVKKRK